MELNSNNLQRMDSISSQNPLVERRKHRPTFTCCLGWSKFESLVLLSMIILNVFLIGILMPLVSSSINTLEKILEKQNALDKKIDNNQQHQQKRLDDIDDMLKLTHDNHNNSHGKVDDLMALANRINKTQEEMKGTQNELDQKVDDIVNSIGINSSILPTPKVTSRISKTVPSASKGTGTNYTVTCLGPCKNIRIVLNFGTDVDLFASTSSKVSSSIAELCKENGGTGRETCTTPSRTTSSTFYAQIYAHRSHRTGTAIFYGSNLISVNSGLKEQPESNNQNLYSEINDLKTSIGEINTNQKQFKGTIDNHTTSLHNIMEKSSFIEEKVNEINATYKDIKELDLKIDDIACSIGSNDNSSESCDLEWNCPTSSDPNYKIVLGVCYYFETTELTQSGAQSNCLHKFGQNVGGLFEPRNTTANQAVHEEATKLGQIGDSEYLWIGVTDPFKNHTYKYESDDKAVPNTMWAQDQPNKKGTENCCAQNRDGLWWDRPCDTENYKSICQIIEHRNISCQNQMSAQETNEACTNLGEGYRWIHDKCYYFEKIAKTFTAAQSNCQDIFGPNTHGKLIEPATMPIFQKILVAAREILSNDDFHVGIQKIDNAGNLKYSSTGRSIPSKFLEGAAQRIKSGMSQPYICYYPSQIKWHDCDGTHDLDSICEATIGPKEVHRCKKPGLYSEINNLKEAIEQVSQQNNDEANEIEYKMNGTLTKLEGYMGKQFIVVNSTHQEIKDEQRTLNGKIGNVTAILNEIKSSNSTGN